MRKRSRTRSIKHWLSHCAWCGREIGENTPTIGIGMKFRDRKDYELNQGKIIEFVTESGRRIPAGVVKPDSPAKKEGKDLLFVICSDQCGHYLTASIREEWALAAANGATRV